MNSKALQNEKFHIENDAKMVPFAGYNMPMWYTSIAEEHICVRDEVGVSMYHTWENALFLVKIQKNFYRW